MPDDADAPDDRTPCCSRRGLLRAGAGGAAALSASTAGCIATLPPLGRRVRYGRVDVPAAGPPDYRRWLPAPSALQDAPSPDKPDGIAWLMTFTPGDLGADVVGEPFGFPIGIMRTHVDHVGVGYQNYSRVVWYGSTFAVEADVDRSAVRDTLDATGYESAGTHHDFALYDRQDVPRALAVGSRGFVYAHGSGAVPDAKAVVDAATSASPRYHETSETFARLSAAVGAAPFTWFHELDEDEPELASASSFTYDDDGVYYVWTRIYAEGKTPSKREVQRELEAQGGPAPIVDPRRAKDVDVSVDGRVVTIEHRQRHERFRESNSTEAPTPQVTWGLDHDRDAETVTLHHEAGDSVSAQQLAVVFAPIVHDGDEPTVAPQFADEYDTVVPGDELTVNVAEWPTGSDLDTELRVVWRTDDGASQAVLLRYDPD